LFPLPPLWLVLGALACVAIAWMVAVDAEERTWARGLLHRLT
jgi:hypothetical protein